jgi:hypothetical protein
MKQQSDKQRRIQEERDRDVQYGEEYDEHILRILQKNFQNWERRSKKRQLKGYKDG